MNWYKLASSYGYWLLPNGKLINVPFQRHDQIAMSLGFLSPGDAIDKGLLSIIDFSSYFSIEGMSITSAQKKSIKNLIFKHRKIDDQGKILPENSVLIKINTRYFRPYSIDDIETL
jgi:hypothetical protein